MDPVSIIIPVRKEEENIIRTLQALEKNVRSPYHVYVLDDSISMGDKTPRLVASYAKKRANIHLLRKKRGDKDGFGAAIKRGIVHLQKKGPVVIIMADLCDDTKLIDLMYVYIQKGADVVSASRYIVGGKKIGGPIFQGFFSWFINKTLKVITKIPTHDISNSFKMYRYTTISQISIDEDSGVECSMHMVLSAYEKGAKIVEIPTTWIGRTQGVSKFKMLERFPRYLSLYLQVIRTFLFHQMKT